MGETIIVTPLEDAKRFVRDIILTKGVKREYADAVAESLVGADYRGYTSHGMIRLEKYLFSIENNLLDPHASPTIESETVATACVNGNNGLGAVIGNFCMDLAIKKAKEVGVGLVAAHNSNHYGVCSFFTEYAISKGCVGLTFCNTSPCSVPIRARDTALGTHPYSIGAPGLDGDTLVVDMATTGAALGKIVLAQKKGKPIHYGWAVNEKGEVTTDADEAVRAKRLLPMGGVEATGGHKGYGIQLFVEVFSGILSGANYGPKIPFWGKDLKKADIGQSFIAIDPKFFAAGFEARLSDLMSLLRNTPPLCKSKPIMIPGDRKTMNKAQIELQGGIIYMKDQHKTCKEMADKYKTKPMDAIEKPKVVLKL